MGMGHCTLLDWSIDQGTSMYVKAYLDLSLKSLVCFGCCFRPVHLGAWPGGSWLPWRAAPLCCVVVRVWFLETSAGMVLSFVSPFHLHNGLRPN